jgi:hypothetical protein
MLSDGNMSEFGNELKVLCPKYGNFTRISAPNHRTPRRWHDHKTNTQRIPNREEDIKAALLYASKLLKREITITH